MKKLLIRSIAVVLCVMISVTSFSVTSFATNKTQAEALAWVKSQVGQSLEYNYDQYYYQCVDFICHYYAYLGETSPGGDGKDYAWNSLPSGWTRVQGGTPQPGDILVYSGNSTNPAGHVAIYESDRSHYHQNFSGSYVEKVTYMYNGLNNPYWGYIRPNWSTHTCSYSSSVTKSATCNATGVRTYTCSCGNSYTESIAKNPNNHAGGTVIKNAVEATHTSEGYTGDTYCKGCNVLLKSGTTVPKIDESEWVYASAIPSHVNTQLYDIEYNNIYKKVATTAPDSSWTKGTLAKTEYVNDGGTYESDFPLSTSDTRVLSSYYYYHWCGESTGNLINFAYTTNQNHYDAYYETGAVIEERSVVDGDDSRYTAYMLAWAHDPSGHCYCAPALTCDPSNSHTTRSCWWYKRYVYQNKKSVSYYNFTKESGWSSEKDSSANAVEYRYKLKSTYDVLYNTNGGSEAPSVQTKIHGTDLILSSITPVKENYIFLGWNTNADGTGVMYQPGDTYSENADLTLYAIWELDHEHEYISEITQQPTCTEKGIKTYTCSVCNDVYYEDIDELGHDYVACVTEPTCTEQGFTTYECSRCGDTYTENYIDPLNHSSSSWHTAINPTATSEGLAEKRCDYCDTVLDQFTIPCLAPDYVTGITLSSDKETVKIGDSFTLSATVIPDTAKNKNVIWSSRNPEIASVDNGKVTANKPGTTAIVAETEDGGYIDFCLVRVVSLVSFNGAVVDNEKNIVYGLSSNLANVDDYLKTADDSMSITFSTATVGTGTFINVMDNGEVIDLYEAVIFGDVNGDGWYDGQDAVLVSCLANGMLTEADVSESVYMAADCNHDGVIDEKDVELLNEAGTLLANVDQSKPEEVLLETSAEYVEYLELINQSPELEVEDETDIPEEDVETEETIPEQNAEFDFFEMIMNFIKLVIEAIRSYIPALYK